MRKINYTLALILITFGFYSSANALTVSPAKLEITGDPGSVLTGEIEIFNEQDETKIFYSSYENFEPSGDSGAPYFIGAKDGLATWIETQAEVTIGAGERAVVPYKITVPQDAAPGGYFAAIFLGNQPTNSANAGEVSIGGKIGVLILLRVSGDIEEKGGLLSFETKDKQRFFSTLPVNFEYKLNNLGGDRVVPNGEIKIKNSFWLTSATLLANKNEGSVLPSSARKFEVVWEDELENVKNKKEIVESEESGFFSTAGKQLKDFHLGFYTAKLNITWGETNQTAKDSFLIFIFPWQLLTIVLFILIIIGFLGRKLIYRYNRWIIAQARANMMNMERYSEPVKTIHPQVKRKRVVRKKIENE